MLWIDLVCHPFFQGVCNNVTIEVNIGETGLVESPLYPGHYPAGIACNWLLKTQPGHRIDVVFEVLALGSNSDCAASRITVICYRVCATLDSLLYPAILECSMHNAIT